MPHPSAAVTTAFVILVVALAAAFLFATWRAARELGEASASRSAVLAAVGIAAWLGFTYALAASGAIARFDTMPPGLLRLVGPTLVLTVLLAFSSFGARLVGGLPLAALVGFQAFRIPVEVTLFQLWREGIVPVQMTFEGMNYDVLSGIGALVVAILAARGTLPRGVLIAWNVMGLALLFTIVTIALLSAPTPFRAFHEGPANTFVVDPPFVWLPGFLVPAALFGHLLVFRWISRAAATP